MKKRDVKDVELNVESIFPAKIMEKKWKKWESKTKT
jgi:hypothetical protein